jgi:hypothetical protein
VASSSIPAIAGVRVGQGNTNVSFFTIGKAFFDEGKKFLDGRKQNPRKKKSKPLLKNFGSWFTRAKGNGLSFTAASEEDRRCSRMVAKKLLVRTPIGVYMLSAMFSGFHGDRTY